MKVNQVLIVLKVRRGSLHLVSSWQCCYRIDSVAYLVGYSYVLFLASAVIGSDMPRNVKPDWSCELHCVDRILLTFH